MFLLGRLISIFLFSISLLGATGCTLDARLSRSETLDGLPSQISYEQKSLYLISGDGQEISYWTNHPPFQADTTTIPVRLSEVQVHSKWCAIIANGDLYCWGSNTNGQLGNGSTAYSEPPVKISSNKKFTQVIAGLVHVCAVDDQKDVYCWGGNSATGGVNSQLTPFKVPLTKPTEATAVSDTDSCALATDKSISCWGARYGVNPIAIVTSEVFISIHGNYDSSFCGLTADGEAFCWGRNTYGQLGTGNTTAQASPTAVQGGHLFAALASYNFGMCGLTFDNDLYCWGQSESGARTTPTLLKSPFGADNLNPNTNGGSSEVCGLTASQQKICVEAFTGESKTEDLQTALIEYNTGCGITDDHMLLCADYLNSSGSGVSYITNPFAYSFITEENFEKIYSSQTENTCAKKKDDNRLYCWGYNYDDIFETGNAQHYRKPVLAAAGKEFKNVSIGDDFVCGIDLNDDAYCSGSNWAGNLGNGTSDDNSTFNQVAGNLKFAEVIAGSSHTCGRTLDGKAYCWGQNYPLLGDGTTDEKYVPTEVLGNHLFKKLAVSSLHTCGLTSDGTVYCWGSNGDGQLGDGTTNDSTVPVKVDTPLVFSDIIVASEETCALDAHGKAYCWGDNSTGFLGDGTTTNRSAPVEVLTNLRFTKLAADPLWGGSVCGIEKQYRHVYCWGYSSHAATYPASTTPTRVEWINSAQDIFFSDDILVVKTSGEPFIKSFGVAGAFVPSLSPANLNVEILNSYEDYCILENSSDASQCDWQKGVVPGTYDIQASGFVHLTLFVRLKEVQSLGQTFWIWKN